ncbi:class I SAM-dependent methyltransferase [Bradyrhizobium sp.]
MKSASDQQLWGSPTAVKFFSERRAGIEGLFRSESLFLNEVAPYVNNVLDVGCACGNFLNVFKTYNPIIRYTGMDLSRNMIEEARSRHPDTPFEVSDARMLRNSNRRYDLVFSSGLLVHCPDYSDVLRSLWSVASRYLLVDLPRISVDDRQIGSMDVELRYAAKAETSRTRGDVPYVLINATDLRNLTIDFLARRDIRGLALFAYDAFYHKQSIRLNVSKLITSCLLVVRGEGPSLYWVEAPSGVGSEFAATCEAFGSTRTDSIAEVLGKG